MIRKKYIVILMLSFLILSLAVSYQILQKINKTQVITQVAPLNSKIKAIDKNGKESFLRTSGSNYLKPGKYTIEVSAEGFSREKKVVQVNKNDSDAILVALDPESTSAYDYKDKHMQEYYDVEGKTAECLDKLIAEKPFNPKSKVADVLPITDPYYTLSYDDIDDNSGDIKLTVRTESPRWRFLAIEKLRQMWYDPSDYEIEFLDYKSPLQEVDQ